MYIQIAKLFYRILNICDTGSNIAKCHVTIPGQCLSDQSGFLWIAVILPVAVVATAGNGSSSSGTSHIFEPQRRTKIHRVRLHWTQCRLWHRIWENGQRRVVDSFTRNFGWDFSGVLPEKWIFCGFGQWWRWVGLEHLEALSRFARSRWRGAFSGTAGRSCQKDRSKSWGSCDISARRYVWWTELGDRGSYCHCEIAFCIWDLFGPFSFLLGWLVAPQKTGCVWSWRVLSMLSHVDFVASTGVSQAIWDDQHIWTCIALIIWLLYKSHSAHIRLSLQLSVWGVRWAMWCLKRNWWTA